MASESDGVDDSDVLAFLAAAGGVVEGGNGLLVMQRAVGRGSYSQRKIGHM